MKLKSHFSREGIPEILYTDNGPQYASIEFAKFVIEWNIDHRTSSSYFPHANGLAKRAVRSSKELLEYLKEMELIYILCY